ncbi:hypothetical protein M5X66_09455 [Providencia sp. PROV188]|uniref:hypothetical protein n=1 Tax=Providencia sp. PROV188 TaxID=2939731 RepID=UPI0022DD524C|nr:hypothetical protein [Providencia sp. PROV188]WBM59241.1 hypothetical protein M5X66_09455 [Providencia sp. PROV188]
MKRIKSKLLIVILLALGAFAYQFYTTIGDSDVTKQAEKLIENKLSSGSPLTFEDVKIVLKSEFKEGECYRVCGFYQTSEQGDKLPFVASVSVQDGKFSEHHQLITSDTPELRTAIVSLCEKSQ